MLMFLATEHDRKIHVSRENRIAPSLSILERQQAEQPQSTYNSSIHTSDSSGSGSQIEACLRPHKSSQLLGVSTRQMTAMPTKDLFSCCFEFSQGIHIRNRRGQIGAVADYNSMKSSGYRPKLLKRSSTASDTDSIQKSAPLGEKGPMCIDMSRLY
ncbi:hypothetical protein BCR41DRAFT_397206 [Lobosporangium transversale]|uniref:Uncharacterized protein n=1 Tax=Lobosporangium transversale TaxID=64571 RepID=A0A1Y2GK46_9FUNG|nr:hypothetical protein BCR41DRAFT_397206 [Lobosporangium transversale]ORZ13388.1 hypothetical protein BCR41DRAFT_397206 [Lobosporangium transversale]|eukprot:XP_021880469.1 hypothetical protein BCR41DRAFT_397206 [Lobosporangium transversale]